VSLPGASIEQLLATGRLQSLGQRDEHILHLRDLADEYLVSGEANLALVPGPAKRAAFEAVTHAASAFLASHHLRATSADRVVTTGLALRLLLGAGHALVADSYDRICREAIGEEYSPVGRPRATTEDAAYELGKARHIVTLLELLAPRPLLSHTTNY
jgi:hypothetical protein